MKIFLLILDIWIICFSSILGLIISNSDLNIPFSSLRIYITQILILTPLWLLFLFLLDFYDTKFITKSICFIYNLFIFLIIATSSGSIYFYLQPKLGISPKTILLLTTLFLCGFIWISRYFIFKVFFEKFKEKIACIGLTPLLQEIIKNKLPTSNYTISTIFTIAHENNLSDFLPFSRDPQTFLEIINRDRIKIVLLSQNKNGTEEKIKLLFSSLPLDIRYISFESFYESLNKKIPIAYIDNSWLLENVPHNDMKLSHITKRTFDIVISIVGLLFFVILFPWIALTVILNSRGPIFYKQTRIGKNGKPFSLFKFRTMASNAEIEGPQWSSPYDKRVTAVGKFLRKLYLDELPQFYNILLGDISVIGPRPERPEFIKQLERHIPFYEIRQTVKPGLTGWAQVNYHASSTVDEAKEKFQYDLYYIKNRSFILDLSIVLKTVMRIFYK